MAEINLGKVVITYKGTYDNSTTYSALDVVRYSGKTYLSDGTVTGEDPSTSTHWHVIAVDGIYSAVAGSGIDISGNTISVADESITVEKVADDLAAVINAKEEKSNKKTTLTGNESSNDFYPTTKAVHDAIENLEAIPYSVKLAMDTLFSKAAYADDDAASSYVTIHAWAISNPATSITAVFTQGSATIYDTDSLDTLKQYLTVTATYSDSTTATVTDYTLSGTLTTGTSTITASYCGKTATFTVTVTHNSVLTGYTSVGTPSISGNTFTPSTKGYIKTLDVFNPGSESWAIRFKVSEGQSYSSEFQNVLRSVDASNTAQKAIFIQDRASRRLYISSDNSTYDISDGQETIISKNTDIFIEIAFDGTDTYTQKTSSDGETWTAVKTMTSNSKVNGGKYIAFGGPISDAPYIGTFYLDTIKIYIGGDLWWQAKA